MFMNPSGTPPNKLEIFSVANIKNSDETKIFGAFIETLKTLFTWPYFKKILT